MPIGSSIDSLCGFIPGSTKGILTDGNSALSRCPDTYHAHTSEKYHTIFLRLKHKKLCAQTRRFSDAVLVAKLVPGIISLEAYGVTSIATTWPTAHGMYPFIHAFQTSTTSRCPRLIVAFHRLHGADCCFIFPGQCMQYIHLLGSPAVSNDPYTSTTYTLQTHNDARTCFVGIPSSALPPSIFASIAQLRTTKKAQTRW